MKTNYPNNPNDPVHAMDYFQTRLRQLEDLLKEIQSELTDFGATAQLRRDEEEHLREIDEAFTARWSAVRARVLEVTQAVEAIKMYSEMVRLSPKGHQTYWTSDDNGYTFAYAKFPSTWKNLAKRLLGKQQDFIVAYAFTFTNKEFKDYILGISKPDTPAEEIPKVPVEAREDLSKHFKAVKAEVKSEE